LGKEQALREKNIKGKNCEPKRESAWERGGGSRDQERDYLGHKGKAPEEKQETGKKLLAAQHKRRVRKKEKGETEGTEGER